MALEAARAGKIASVEASQATDADVEIPRPDGLEYLPYQKAGIAFLLRKKGGQTPSLGTLLADEMG
jgi:SWI/SNF-related matrix-associated actin-dependent regulator 1 of chromatin subfamily A